MKGWRKNWRSKKSASLYKVTLLSRGLKTLSSLSSMTNLNSEGIKYGIWSSLKSDSVRWDPLWLGPKDALPQLLEAIEENTGEDSRTRLLSTPGLWQTTKWSKKMKSLSYLRSWWNQEEVPYQSFDKVALESFSIGRPWQQKLKGWVAATMVESRDEARAIEQIWGPSTAHISPF